MEYIKSQNPEKYKLELAELAVNGGTLIKNPKGELKSVYGLATASTILAGCGLFLTTFGLVDTLISGKFTWSAALFFIVIYALLIFIIMISILMFSMKKKILNRAHNDDHLDCDKEGLIFITSKEERKSYWENYKAIRAFKYSIAFIPKDRKGMFLIAPIENLQNVIEFLEENDIKIEVIR